MSDIVQSFDRVRFRLPGPNLDHRSLRVVDINEKEEVKELLKTCMERAITLKVPLIADISEAENWYECK